MSQYSESSRSFQTALDERDHHGGRAPRAPSSYAPSNADSEAPSRGADRYDDPYSDGSDTEGPAPSARSKARDHRTNPRSEERPPREKLSSAEIHEQIVEATAEKAKAKKALQKISDKIAKLEDQYDRRRRQEEEKRKRALKEVKKPEKNDRRGKLLILPALADSNNPSDAFSVFPFHPSPWMDSDMAHLMLIKHTYSHRLAAASSRHR